MTLYFKSHEKIRRNKRNWVEYGGYYLDKWI